MLSPMGAFENPLTARIRSITGDVFVIAPDDLEEETRENTYLVSCSEQERRTVSPEEVVDALRDVATSRRRALAASAPEHTMTFYAWHDEQAGQLRLSTRSCREYELPFGVIVDTAASLGDVVVSFLASQYVGEIPRDELSLVPGGEDGVGPSPVLQVFAERLSA